MSSSRGSKEVKKLIEQLEEVERVNAKLKRKEKEKEFKFTKAGCERQYKFNEKMKDMFGDKLKNELKKHFKNGLPDKVEEIIKEDEKELDEQNHKWKIADEFGFKSLDDFVKEDLARDDTTECGGKDEVDIKGGSAGRSGQSCLKDGHLKSAEC